uniref:Uncharacterized protein n=1 Tax=Setaria italica TaxID=4555 RepID=K3ZMD8_SETIT
MRSTPTSSPDSSDNRRCSYPMPFSGATLCVSFSNVGNTITCPVCPGMRQLWKILNEVKDHILGMTTFAPLRGENKNKWSHHRVVA